MARGRKVKASVNDVGNGDARESEPINKRKRSANGSAKDVVKEEPKGFDGTVDTNRDEKGVTKKQLQKATKLESILPPNWYEKNESKVFIGAHVSISGGVENSVYEAAALGAQAVGLFLCSQRTWNVKPFEQSSVEKFKKACQEYGFPPNLFLPHASYLCNMGSGDATLREKSRNLFLDGLTRCDQLGIELYNFHPGSTAGKISVEECIQNIADGINHGISKTKKVICVIENMCKQGNTIGGDFKEIRAIIDKVHDKSRVGVCLDTCHAYAAGYQLNTEEGFNAMMEEFDKVIGLNYLKAVHLNDAKGGCNSHLDRHENIGKGELGLQTFHRLVNDPRFKNIPMILETPVPDTQPLIYKKEVEILYGLYGKEAPAAKSKSKGAITDFFTKSEKK